MVWGGLGVFPRTGTDGRTDSQTDGRTDRSVDRYHNKFPYFDVLVKRVLVRNTCFLFTCFERSRDKIT